MENPTETRPDSEGISDHERPSSSRFHLTGIALLFLIALIGALVFFTRPWKHHVSPTPSSTPAQEEDLPRTPPTTSPTSPAPSAPQPASSTAQFPDLPEAPPAETELLLEELIQVTDYLQQRIPDHPDSFEISARVQLWLGNTDEAVRLWEKCLELDPHYGHAYFGLGTVAAKKGEYKAAAEFFRKSLQMPPMSPEVLVALGNALVNSGEIDEAIAVLNSSPASTQPSARCEALLGQAHLQKQEYEAARTHYERAVTLEPYSSDSQYGLAMALARLGDTEKAATQMARFNELRAREREIRTGGKRAYDDSEATRQEVAGKYTDIGAVLFSRNLDLEAERLWLRATKLSPQDANCRQALAWLYRKTDRRRDAIRMLEELAEIDPNGIQYPLEIGRIHAELGEFDAAARMFQQVRQKAPQAPEGYLAAARLYVDSRRNLPEAVALAREAVELEARASNYELLSEAHEMNGNRTKALAAIERAMILAPDEPRLRQRHERLKAEQ